MPRRIQKKLWFPEHGAWTQSRLAKQLCGSCPFLDACREWALEHPSDARYGIWGGMTERERREELRGRGYVEPFESDHEEVAA